MEPFAADHTACHMRLMMMMVMMMVKMKKKMMMRMIVLGADDFEVVDTDNGDDGREGSRHDAPTAMVMQ